MKSQELLQDQKNWSNAKKLLLQKLLHGKADTNSIPKAQESNLYPLSLAQKRIWFLEELVPNQAVFNVPMAFKIEGKLDVGILKNSIKELSKRHRILSSKVVIEHGEPYQTLSHESPELTIVSPQHEEEADWQWAEKLAAQEAQKPISIHEGNYARFTLYAVADDQYLLVMVLHHIICDGWSFGIIFEELANAYKKLTGQSSSQQHDLPIQYTDFAVWQNQPAYLNTALPHIQYWKSKLQGKKATQPLSFKQPLKTNELTYQGKRLYFEWNTSLTSQLERYAKANKVTLNMLLTALYKLVFYCYTHEKNNLLGIPIANRNLPELEKLVGFVANTLVIQTEIDESQSFTTFMEQVKETCLNAYKHQDAPFEKVIEALQPERQLNHSQLFQTAFIFQNAPMKRVDFANLTLSMVDIHNGTAQFEISLTMTMLQDRLKGFFEYQQCLFSDQDIQHFSEKFEALALCMLKNPDLPIYQLKEQLNIPAQLAPAPQPIYNISKRFEAIAQQYPHAIAIKYGASELSYQQLNQKANTLAHQLIDHGVKPNDLVAIFCHKSTEMLIGLIAILKAGAAYLPLDPINPQARIKLILEQAAVNTLLLQPDLQETFDNLGINAIQRLHLRSDEEETETNPDRQVSDLQQAYVMFTSGSTGIPKGVMVSHLNVCRLFDALEQEIKFNHQDVWTLFHSFAFDFSVWEIWGALLYGGKLIIVDYWESRSPETFYKLVHKNKVSVLSQTPSAFYQLMDQWLENNQASTGALRVVVFGGEALHLQRLSPWIERFGAQKPALINMYGITETTVHVTNYKVSKQELVAEHLIGEPIADLSVHVYDENMQVVDDLQEGEMYVGGLGVSQGYYNSPRLTAQRFVPDPYSTKGERLFKTGDTAIRNTQGLVYRGRIDNQIQIRGFRIELGEIKAAFLQHAHVKDVVLQTYQVTEQEQQLLAYVILHPNHTEQQWIKVQEKVLFQWQNVFNKTYEQSDDATGNFNIIGWNSSYSGKEIPEIEMREWLTNTLALIQTCAPKHVLELGSGTGMILLHLLESIESYVGLDLSETAIAFVKQQLDQYALEQQDKVELHIADALNLPDSLNTASIDCLIINSVIQYFPNIAYFEQVIHQTLPLLAAQSSIFIGDVRSLTFQKHFYFSIIAQNPANLATEEIINQQLLRLQKQENELVISSDFFHQLADRHPQINCVEVMAKKDSALNEMSVFRYDVILHLGTEAEEIAPSQWIVWQDAASLSMLRKRLLTEKPPVLGLAHVPNTKIVSVDLEMQRYGIHQTNHLIARSPSPFELEVLAKELGYFLKTYWVVTANQEAVIDCVFYKNTQHPPFKPYAAIHQEVDSSPALSFSNFNLEKELALKKALHQYLKRRLPDYMIPNKLYFMDKFPLTANGKINYKELPIPKTIPAGSLQNIPLNTDLTATEKALIPIWLEVLQLDQIDVHDNFFELGGHSLQAAKLVYLIKDQLTIELPLRHLMLDSTISGMAKIIEQIQEATQQGDSYHATLVDLRQEATLPATILPHSSWQTRLKQTVLLTGATGFVGAFLLRELLDSEVNNVICLVRANDEKHGFHRVRKNLEAYQLWKETDAQKLSIVIGDLALVKFGLTDTDFEKLGEHVDLILHNGAMVNFVYPYHELKGANVVGTQEVIRLACTGPLKEIHYISTIYVFSQKDFDVRKMVYEHDEALYWEDHRMGYTQTKWVAEQLILEARKRGVPTSIYRPGRILGHSHTGACQEDDFLWKVIKSSIQLGKAPKMNTLVDMTPADYFSSMVITHMLQESRKAVDNYHIFNVQTFTLHELINWVKKFGYHLETITYDEWQELIIEKSLGDSSLAASDLLPLFMERIEIEDTPNDEIDADTSNYQEVLEKYQLTSPQVTETILENYFNYFIQSGYLPQPF